MEVGKGIDIVNISIFDMAGGGELPQGQINLLNKKCKNKFIPHSK